MNAIMEKLTVVEFDSINDFTNDLLNKETSDWLPALEKEYPDAQILFDKNLESLIETLTYNGVRESAVVEMNENKYRNTLDIYKVNREDFYIMMTE